MRASSRGDDIEEIRAANDIVEVISRYVPLKQSGKNLKGLCPFHKERTPSFNVNPENQFFYCFGCGVGGDVFNFIMRIENMTFPEAAEFLAERVGMRFSSRMTDRDSEEFRKKEELYKINLLASEYFHDLLIRSDAGREGREYLMKRGITPATMEEFKLGYSLPAWDGLLNFMVNKGFSGKQLEEAGLVLSSKNYDGYYDRFRDRLIFTIWDPMGRVIAFGGRTMNDEEGPKYLNSPETVIFEKSKGLYGLNLAKDEIRRTGKVVLVEGYMDVIAAHQGGIRNVVASMGTSLTEGQIRLILRYAREVLIAYDADVAGTSATLRGLEMLRAAGARVQVVSLPSGMDPDDVIRQEGADAFRDFMGNALSLAEYRVKLILKKADISSVEGKSRAVQEVVSFLVTLDDAVEEEEYARRFAREIGVSENAILLELGKARRRHLSQRNPVNKIPKTTHTNDKNVNSTNNIKRHQISVIERAEKTLLRLIIEEKELRQEAKGRLGIEGFINPRVQALATKILEMQDLDKGLLLKKLGGEFISASDMEMMHLLAEISLLEVDTKEKRRVFDDCIKYIKKYRLDEKIKALDEEIKILASKGDDEGVRERLKCKGDLMKERGKLSSFHGIS